MAYCIFSGRFGNNLHQLAATLAHSKRLNEACYSKNLAWFNRFKRLGRHVTVIKSPPPGKVYKESHYTRWVDPVTLPPLTPGLHLFGCWESAQYFADYTDTITDMFHCDDGSTETVGVHIRRGDFVSGKDHHVVLDMTWYHEAIKLLDPGSRIMVFSDDIEWCKKQFNNVVFVNTGSAFGDWAALRCCRDFIISNSTFSWWAAYLGTHKNKRVICPSRWYKLGIDIQSYKFAPGWTALPNDTDGRPGVKPPIFKRTISFPEIRELLRHIKHPRILEIGAHDGQDTARFLDTIADCQVIAFEPDNAAAKAFRARLAGHQRVVLHELALGNLDGPVQWYTSSNNHMSSSMRRPTEHLKRYPNIKFGEPTTVQCAKLDNFNDIFDFAWIDCQGAQRDVIAGGRRTLDATKYIYIEIHNYPLYDGETTFAELCSLLPKHTMIAKYGENVLFSLTGQESYHTP